MDENLDQVFPIFIGVWIALGICSLFFFLNNNAALKRKVFPFFAVGVGVLFLGFGIAMGFLSDGFSVAVMVPGVALITYLNLRSTKFCDSCGKTLINQNPFASLKFCSRCGADLES